MDHTDHALFPRFSAGLVATALKDTPVVMVTGPRQCGKTTLVRDLVAGILIRVRKCPLTLYMDTYPSTHPDAVNTASTGLANVLQYVVPHQEVMTHIDVSDDNSTAEQNMVRADRVELSPAF
jgi:energy-coupling factor transporter ATP-binding protein EcfA2